jgi:putative flavoprotein involved in K+ transport
MGKKVVVIGSNNSATTSAPRLWETGADVTMVQRSSTHIVKSDTLMDVALGGLYSEAASQEWHRPQQADLIFASLPYAVLPAVMKPQCDETKKRDKKFYDRLKKAGFDLDFGADETGLFLKYLRRGSGYYIDVGASELVADGKIKLARGQVDHLTEDAVVLEDGTELPPICRLRHRLWLDERLGREAHLAGRGRQGGQVLGPRLRHPEGPRPLGRRAAQHVEADPAGSPVVPRRQPAPVAPLLAVPVAAVEGSQEGLKTPAYGLQKVHHLS